MVSSFLGYLKLVRLDKISYFYAVFKADVKWRRRRKRLVVAKAKPYALLTIAMYTFWGHTGAFVRPFKCNIFGNNNSNQHQ